MTASIIPFPTRRKVGKIRDTARRWIDKPTERSAVAYAEAVTRSMEAAYLKLGVSDHVIDDLVGSFWLEVDREVNRLSRAQEGYN